MNKIQNENWVNALPNEAVKVAEEINVEIAKVIAERIKTIGELSPADAKKINNSIQYLGADFSKITKLIAKYSKKGQMAVVDMLQKTADGNDEFAKTFYSAKGLLAVKWREDPYLRSLVEGMARQTIAEFTNLSQTLAYKIDDSTLTLRQMYTRAIDKAIYEVHSGTVDYHTAMRKTIKQLASNMKVVKWDSGYVRRLDSHVRQNLLDGVKQLQSQMLDYHGEKYGSDGVEISAHAISAPDHAPVQGRQFSNENFTRMQSGLSFKDVKGNEYEGFPRPISQWNCKHIKFRIIIGVSEPAYTEEQLRTFAENSKKKYELTQQQRAMETKLRKLKNERLAHSAAGDELEAKRTQRKINELQAKYRKFSDNNNLLYNTKRASVEGYRRISAKVVEESSNFGVGTPTVDLGYINSKEYKNKFSKLSNNQKLNLEIYERCKAILTHQNGKFYEDLSVVDENGVLIGATSSKIINETKYTETLNKKVFACLPYSLVSIHNHGTNLPPTGSDLVSAGYHRYHFGVICCHDGTIYQYSVKNAKSFTRELFDNTVDKFEKRGYTKYSAMVETLKAFQRDYGIDWSEIK